MPESEPDADGDASTPDEDAYVRATLYLQNDTKRSFERWMKRLELDHRIVEDTPKQERYDTLIQLAMEHEDEFIDALKP